MDDLEKGPWKRGLEPVDHIIEMIFGLLMAMTFIGSLCVATSGRGAAHTMIIVALGCNLAWGWPMPDAPPRIDGAPAGQRPGSHRGRMAAVLWLG